MHSITVQRLLRSSCFLILTMAYIGAAAMIWREGEMPTRANVARHPWWYDKVLTNQLSGGDWISNFSDAQMGELDYEFEVSEAGTYVCWLHVNRGGASLKLKLDKNDWQPVDLEKCIDRQNIAEDGKNDIRYIAWVNAGTFTLSKGAHTLSFKMDSENSHHGALDAFMLTTDTTMRPSGVSTPAPDEEPVRSFDVNNSWAFEPQQDLFADNAVLDLRYLNEKTSGEHGFIGLSSNGMDFVRGDGQPIRFWSVVGGPGGGGSTLEEMQQHCRFLAKLGVNMVRIHGGVYNASEGAKITDVNDKEIDNIFKFVAAAKSNGIYLTISPYWAAVNAPASWGIEGYVKRNLLGILFFNEKLQNAYKVWVKELYTRVNPYTGLALKDDPTVAIIQIKNEDSLLFYTFDRIEGPQRKLLRAKFGAWAAETYGTIDRALEEWGGESTPGDDPENGELDFYQTWFLTQPPPANAGRAARMRDQLEFLACLQYDFYADIGRYYRETLGCKQLINAMNWKSADAVTMGDAERWTYTANEVVAVNRYTGVIHTGENNGYRIDPGHFFVSEPVVKNPGTLPCALKQVVGYPFIITETSWVHPAEYQSEGPFLAAAYMSLTGVDSFYWFAVTNPMWLLDPRRMFWPVGQSYAIDKWSCSVPELMGQFPANALAFRRGYIAEASKPVVHEERSLDSIWARQIPVISEEGTFDPNRDEGSFAKNSTIKQEVDRLAFLVGPVEVKYDGDESRTYIADDLDNYIDREHGIVCSVTDQIKWDYKTGVCSVNAPKYQGVAGFLLDGGGRFDLDDVTIDSSNNYATIIVTTLDELPIAESRKILVQVGTTARLNGWATRKVHRTIDGRSLEMEEIIDTGNPPWCIANTRANLTIKNAGLRKATLLDVSGYAGRPIPITTVDDGVALRLPLNTMYLVLEGEGAPPRQPRAPAAPVAEQSAAAATTPSAAPNAPAAPQPKKFPMLIPALITAGVVIIMIVLLARRQQ